MTSPSRSTEAPLTQLEYLARLPVHRGAATLKLDGVQVAGRAELILPSEGNAVVAFLLDSVELTGDFVSDVVIAGSQTVVPDPQLPQYFSETFGAYVAMRSTNRRWRKLPSYCGSLEDCPYLEQKFASLMIALEFFIRNCLLETGTPEARLSKATNLSDLIGAARRDLQWNVPKHYDPGDTTRVLRNAVMHGGDLPTKDNAEFRLHFNKWRLFLFRRVLLRLGYTGAVLAPYQGTEVESAVDDFSAAYNSFEPDGDAARLLIAFRKKLSGS